MRLIVIIDRMATTDEVGDEVSCDSEEENDGYHDQPAG